MKKLLLAGIFAFSLLTFTSVNAQTDAKSPATAQDAQRKPDWKAIKTKLGLSNDQVTKIKGYADIAKTRRDAVRNDKLLSDQQRAERLQNIKDELHEKVASVLTAEQKAKIQAYKDRKEASPLDVLDAD